MKKIQSLLLVSFLLPLFLSAQSAVLNINLPERVTVCDSSLFSINVSNPGGIDLTSLTVTVDLPGSLKYQNGTVSGATEQNVANVSLPVFSMANLPAGENRTFEFFVFADCDVFSTINSGVIFSTKVTADFTGGNAEITSDPFPVETPFLVVTKTNPRLLIGSRGDIFQREIEIRNTRLGALRSFRFRDTHQSGIEITVPLKTDADPAPTTYAHTFTGADFQAIGDGDDLFEFNESFKIIEQIIITSCGNDLSFAKSKVEVDWGCKTRFCQKNETAGFVSIEDNDKTPELIFEPVAVAPSTCFCDTGGETTQSIKITNIGDDDALNITLVIDQDSLTDNTGILPSTFIMDSAGVDIPLTDVTPFGGSSANSCDISETAFNDVIVRIPVLRAGVTVEVQWDVAFCQRLCDQRPLNRWTLETSYKTLCPPPDDQTILEDFTVVSELVQGTGGLDNLQTVPDPDGEDSSITDLQLWLKNNWLLSSGTLRLTLVIDQQIQINNAFFLLDNIPPNNPIQGVPSGSNFIYTLEYPLPFSIDSVSTLFSGQIFCDRIAHLLPECIEEQQTTCFDPCTVPITPQPVFPITVTAQYLLDGNDACDENCVPTTCFSTSVAPLCEVDSICRDTILGYIDFEFQTGRENIGLLDADDNRVADSNSPADRSQIRDDRFIPGDTLLTKLTGWVVGDDPNFSASMGVASLSFSSVSPLDVSDVNQFYYGSGIELVGAEIQIIDASTGNQYACDDLSFSRAVAPNLGAFTFDISPAEIGASCGLPSDFLYEPGDSVSMEIRIRFIENLNLPEGWRGDPPSIQFSSFSTMRIFNDEDEPEFFCRCSDRLLELSNYDFKLTPKEYGLDPCGVSDFSIGDLFEIRLAEGNFFPFEVRPLVQMTNYIVEPDLPVDIREVQLASLNLQGAGNLFENENLSFTKTGNAFEIDLMSFQTDPLLDEGFFMFIKYKLESDCSLDGKIETDFTTDLNFLHEFPGVPIDFTLTEKLDAFNILAPDLRVTSLFPDIESNDRFGRWDLEIFNRITRIGDVESGDALNTFLYVNSQNDVFTKFELLNVTTGQLIPLTDGIFQLGNLPPDVRFPYQLSAESESCDNENLLVHFGWNCEPLTDSLQADLVCFKNTLPLEVRILPGEIETILDTARISGDLCDTMPFFTIEIFNAELGSLYDLFLDATLPPGLLVAPGTSQIAHPNTDNFLSVDDPENLGNGFYKWQFNDLNDSLLIRGLPSVLSSPSNSLILRFRTITDCNFIAESFPTFNVAGFQNCDRISNSRARAAKPVSITGVFPPYGMGVSADDLIFADCDDTTTLNFRLTPDAMPEDRDSILLTLPPGLTYIPGSYVGNANASPDQPIIENNNFNQVLKWVISPNLNPGDPIEVQIRVQGLLSMPCGREFIQLQAVATTSALCVATNENCDIRVQTGGLFIPLDINRPDLSLTNFTTEILSNNGNDRVVYSLQVNNSNSNGSAPIRVSFYQDVDGSGGVSPGDILVHNDSLVVTGGMGTLSGTFIGSAEELCNLLAVADAEENCACNGDILALSGKIERTFVDPFIACSEEAVSIGLDDVSGSNFQWIPTDNLSCDTCSRTDFVIANNSPVPLDFNFQLIENNAAGCLIENNFTVTVRPQPDILLQNSEICLGECILLETTDGTTADWSGGNVDPNDPTVCPLITTDYMATVKDTFGCENSATITVDVLPLPSVDAGVDLEFCLGQILSLNGSVSAGASPVWSPSFAVSNSGILNPNISVVEPTTITLTAVDANGCESSDDVFVDTIQQITIRITDDVQICVGTEATLTASGATNYEWTPNDNLSCSDCPSITVMPTDTTTYTVTGSLDGFCESSIDVTVFVVDTIKTSRDSTICEGESVLIHGEIQIEPDVYEGIFETADGCDSIDYYTLFVIQKPEFTIDTIFPCPVGCEGKFIFESSEPDLVFSVNGVNANNSNTFDSICLNKDYVVRAENLDKCFSVLDTINLQRLNFDSIKFEIVRDTIRLGDSIRLSLIFPPGIDSSTLDYRWSPSEFVTCDTCSTTIAFPTEDSTDFTVVVTDPNGCVIERSIKILITEVCALDAYKVPNIFSPNGDGINDVFKPFTEVRGATLDFLSIKVYNRWGEKVYEGEGIDAGWDGTYKGEDAISDVYIYVIEMGCGDEKIRRDPKDVTLYR